MSPRDHVTEHEAQLEAQRVAAFRALLARPLLGVGSDEFALVRRHFRELRRRFSDLLGYELVLRADHARLRKLPVHVDATRPARIVPGAREKVAEDRWRPFTPRHYALFALSLAALEQSPPQTTISLLARSVGELAREESIALDLERREHRKTLAEAVELLVHLGVLVLEDGESDAWVRSDARGEEALYGVRHGELTDLLVARGVSTCSSAAEVVTRGDDYPPTDEGRRNRLRHRLARRLVEEPVLYLDELPDDERTYYASSQRPHLDGRVAELTGLQAERRAEGTAMVEPVQQARALTDLRFPFKLTDRQAALLLCAPLAQAHYEGLPGMTRAELLREMRALVERYGSHWGRTSDAAEVAALLDEALRVLVATKLVAVEGELVRPRPALARFQSADVRAPRSPRGVTA
jgi:uncharacterized protein (TIGR02678 family)